MSLAAARPRCELVLVGGGHAHVQVLRNFAMRPWPGVRLTLVALEPYAPYSGMLPGHLAGFYSHDESHFDLRAIARRAGARFIAGEVEGLDLEARRVRVAGRPPLAFDLLSIDVGSRALLPEGAQGAANVLPGRPVSGFLRGWAALERELAERSRGSAEDGPFSRATEDVAPSSADNAFSLAVVGGGAAGLEVALVAARKFRRHGLKITVFERGAEPLSGHAPGVRRRLLAHARALGIELRTGEAIVEAGGCQLRGESGRTYRADRALWFTGAGSHPWFRASGLAVDERGFLAVDRHLRSPTDPAVFGAGDCASFGPRALPKNGVYAVREGRTLVENLERSARAWHAAVAGAGGRADPGVTGPALARVALAEFRPQRRALALITTGDRRVVASYGTLAAEGAALWEWKDRIDRRFMERFSLDRLPPAPLGIPHVSTTGAAMPKAGSPGVIGAAGGAAMLCGGCGSKVGATALSRVLARVSEAEGLVERPELVRGLRDRGDVTVVEAPAGRALVQSIDYFRAFLDDPFLLGRVSTVHALSDLYAAGAEPVSALALAQVVAGAERDTEEELFQLLSGAARELRAAGVALAGGHSVQGPELAFGLSVQGMGYAQRLRGKGGLRPGDRLVLTRALGTGVILAAHEQRRARGDWVDRALAELLVSNAKASDILRAAGVTACTDVTGFGLVGHLLEMLRASGAGASLRFDAIPVLPAARAALAAGVLSSLDPDNRRLGSAIASWGGVAKRRDSSILFDPQTSGGLLFGCAPGTAGDLVRALREAGYAEAAVIGEVTARDAAAPAEAGWITLEEGG